jgi:hypothetical protein
MPAVGADLVVHVGKEAAPGTDTVVIVDLHGDGIPVASATTDLEVAAPLYWLAKADGSPDCEIDIESGTVQFAFVPESCSDGLCTSVRAELEATPPADDFGVAYSCQVQVPPDTQAGLYDTTIVAPRVVSGDGSPLPVNVRPAQVSVPQIPKQAQLILLPVEAHPGETVQLDALIQITTGAHIVETDLDFYFDPPLRIVGDANGVPRCPLNPTVDKEAEFDFGPPGCLLNDSCTGIGAFIGDLDLPAFVSDTTLFSCLLQIAPDAEPGTYYPACHAGFYDIETGSVRPNCGSAGVRVLAPEPATPTASPTATPTATDIPSPTPTAIPTGTGGCAVAPGTNRGALWLAGAALLGTCVRRLRRPR